MHFPLPSELFTLGYIDPGSGSMAIQMILASALGTMFALRRKLVTLAQRMLRIRSATQAPTTKSTPRD